MNQIITMIQTWNKVNTLVSQNLKIAQISRILGIDRKTVRRYRDMSQEQISALVDREVNRRLCKLEPYRDFVTNLLKEKPMLSSPQVHDRLLENYPSFPEVSTRTMYSFVKRIRNEEDIPNEPVSFREFARVPQRPYGKQAQVDFGEMFIDNSHGSRTKVYFMLMVLSRSCYKFAYFQSYPFTSSTAVYAHHMAFRYFGGVPEEVVYDQDCTFLVDENYGKYHMTSALESYVLEVGYNPIFMMAHDPQSKGLCEVYVRYIKSNFLRGRVYVNDEMLNDECIGWLERTGNQNRHSVYRFVPSAEFTIEKDYLKEYKTKVDGPEMYAKSYVVRKDNTISYKGNLYSVPLGNYQKKGSRVLVVANEADLQIEIYGESDCRLIATHDIVTDRKGTVVVNPEHQKRPQSKTLLQAEVELTNMLLRFSDEHCVQRYLDNIYNAGPRYYRKAVIGILHILKKENDVVTLENTIQAAQEQPIVNPNDLQDYLDNIEYGCGERPQCDVSLPEGITKEDITPATRSISEYNKYFGMGRKLDNGTGDTNE